VDSAFVGLRKPDPAIYALTLERLDLPAEACVFIDDLEPNIVAARECGLHAVHFRDTEQTIDEVRTVLATA
jgi:putative hydrolase of the HAD superfamily